LTCKGPRIRVSLNFSVPTAEATRQESTALSQSRVRIKMLPGKKVSKTFSSHVLYLRKLLICVTLDNRVNEPEVLQGREQVSQPRTGEGPE
jgi:hypothetical protein